MKKGGSLMKSAILTTFAVAAATTLASHAALAAPPVCGSGDALRGYQSGYQLESGLLRSLFKSRFTCGSYESFVHAVRLNLTSTRNSDLYLMCRDIGIGEGMADTIRKISEDCQGACSKSGESIGELGAEQYCPKMMAMALTPEGPAEPVRIKPLPLCDVAAAQSCRAAFISYVEQDFVCKDFAAHDPDFESIVDAACALLR